MAATLEPSPLTRTRSKPSRSDHTGSNPDQLGLSVFGGSSTALVPCPAAHSSTSAPMIPTSHSPNLLSLILPFLLQTFSPLSFPSLSMNTSCCEKPHTCVQALQQAYTLVPYDLAY